MSDAPSPPPGVDPYADVDLDGLLALAPHLARLLQRVGSVGGAFVRADVLKAFQAHGLSPSLNHYYSPIPDVATLPARLWEGAAFATGWSRVDVGDWRGLLDAVLEHAPELADVPRTGTSGFFWDNPMFPPLDAVAYYGLVRALRPRTILEIGSGYSTVLAHRAMDANGTGTIRCIEPYPRDFLLAMQGPRVSIERAPVQQVPDAAFRALGAGDVLFIDTSHVVKAGSDVNDLLFRVLPLVRRGVLVHIHDMFLPYEYPRAWFDEIGIVWNEQYAVLAMLMDSARWRVRLPNYLASRQCRDELERALAGFDIQGLVHNLGGAQGASLWLETLRD